MQVSEHDAFLSIPETRQFLGTPAKNAMESIMVASPEIPFVDGMNFAVGVDTATGSARNAAATGAPSPVTGMTGGITSFHMEQVETVEDLMNSIGISAKANGGIGLFSASARFSFAQSCKINSSSVFLVVSVQVTEAFQSIERPGIDPNAAQLIATGDTDRFREEFGDTFVRGIRSGGQFFGVVEVETRDQADSEAISAGLTASYAAFGASGSFDKKFMDTCTSHRTKVTCHIEGGQNLPLPTNLTTMTDRAINFPGELAGHGVPYLALLDDYGVLPLPKGPNFADLQQQKDVLIECARLRNLHEQWLNNLDYISGHSVEFVDPDNAQLEQLRTDINADLNVIADSASQAMNDPKSAQFPIGLRVTSPKFPERVRNAAAASSLTLDVGPNSDVDFPRILRDVPDNFQATTTLTVSFSGSAPSSARRHAGIGVFTPHDNTYRGVSKRADVNGQTIGQVVGIVGSTPTSEGSTLEQGFTGETVTLRIIGHRRHFSVAQFSSDGIQFTDVGLRLVGKASVTAEERPEIKVALFAFSGDGGSFTAAFSEPEIVTLPETA